MISPEDDDNAFSTKSGDQSERIEARRRRIRARLEEARKAAEGTKTLNEDDLRALRERNRKSIQQMIASRLRLFKLRKDGLELSSNVRVAFTGRELQRRDDESENQKARYEKIEAEKIASYEGYYEVTRKWEVAEKTDLAEELRDLLVQQKQQCDAVIEEKEKLISDFQEDLRLKDDRYVKDLKRQGDDVDMILERMEMQINTWTSSYLEELAQIEVAFESERGALVQDQKVEWEEMLKKRRTMEMDNVKAQQLRVQDNQQMLHDIRNHDSEEMSQLKNRLENEIQVLQQQMEATKASYQLNTEKLEYNYHVLRKRDEENSAMRNAQKRQLSSLNDQYMNMKKKLRKAQEQSTATTQQLSVDYRRITEQFRDLEKKAKHFSQVDKSRYRGIWKMNEEIARQKVEKQLALDRVVHEQQLGAPWQAPPDVATPTLLDDGRVVRAGMRSARDLAKAVLTPTASQTSLAADVATAKTTTQSSGVGPEGKPRGEGPGAEFQDPADRPSLDTSALQRGLSETESTRALEGRDLMLQSIPDALIQQVLELLVSEASYLMEPNIDGLVATLEPDEQLLMKVDSLFKVLFVENEDDVRLLVSYFIEEVEPLKGPILPYADDGSGAVPTSSSAASRDQPLPYEPSEVASNDLVPGTRRLSRELPSSAFDTMSPSVAESVVPSRQSQTYAAVAADKVQTRLNAFVREHNTALPAERSFWSTSRLASKNTVRVDEEFWRKLSDRIPDSKIQMWKALRTGLQSYLEVLKHREQQELALSATMRQNEELEYVLMDYRSSEANWKLRHPPQV